MESSSDNDMFTGRNTDAKGVPFSPYNPPMLPLSKDGLGKKTFNIHNRVSSPTGHFFSALAPLIFMSSNQTTSSNSTGLADSHSVCPFKKCSWVSVPEQQLGAHLQNHANELLNMWYRSCRCNWPNCTATVAFRSRDLYEEHLANEHVKPSEKIEFLNQSPPISSGQPTSPSKSSTSSLGEHLDASIDLRRPARDEVDTSQQSIEEEIHSESFNNSGHLSTYSYPPPSKIQSIADLPGNFDVNSISGRSLPIELPTSREEDFCDVREDISMTGDIMGSIESGDDGSSDNKSDIALDETRSCYSDDISTVENSEYSLKTEESTSDSELSPLKRNLVDRVMREFFSLFATELSPGPDIVENSETDTPIREHKGSSSVNTSQVASGSLELNNKSQRSNGKRRVPDGEPPEDNEGKEDRKKARLDLSFTYVQGMNRRYACHFHQHEPSRYCSNDLTGHKYRTCSGPGWDDVHRVKEHLYRCHTAPIECGRCYVSFKTKDELTEHTRADSICERKEARKGEGINEDKMAQLRRRKRSSKEGNDEEKRWKDIYAILFPGEIVPSPFYNNQPYHTMSPSSSKFSEYEEFTKRELPRLVRAGLEKLVSEEMQPLEETLKGKMVDLARESQQSILDKFKAAYTSSQRSEPDDSPLRERSVSSRIPINWGGEFPSESIAQELPDQAICPPMGTPHESAPHIAAGEFTSTSEDHQPWALFTPPPPLDNSTLQPNLDTFPKTDSRGQYSDSGYATLCICKSSSHLAAEPGSSKQQGGHEPPSHGLSNDNNGAPNDNANFLSTESSFLEGFDQFDFMDFMLPKCDRCGGDKGEWMNPSISFDPNVSMDDEQSQ